MFSAMKSKVMAVCAIAMMMMMMMMMTEAAAMSKGTKTHRKSSEGAAVETVPLQLHPDDFVPSRNLRPLENASISPWAYNVSSNDALFPPQLYEAHCLLRGCLDSEGQEDLSLESRPIMHQVLMLRRVGSAGQGYHFRLESRLVAVGCTCVRPIVQVQQ